MVFLVLLIVMFSIFSCFKVVVYSFMINVRLGFELCDFFIEIIELLEK